MPNSWIIRLTLSVAVGICSAGNATFGISYPDLPPLSSDVVIENWHPATKRDGIYSGDAIISSSTGAYLSICEACDLYSSSFNIRMAFQTDCNLVIYEGVDINSEN
ncbi:hypothetical protein HK100_008749, partial [Physocladia obscura]